MDNTYCSNHHRNQQRGTKTRNPILAYSAYKGTDAARESATAAKNATKREGPS